MIGSKVRAQSHTVVAGDLASETAAAGEITVSGISNAAAASVTVVHLVVGGTPLVINFSAAGLESFTTFADVTTAAHLTTVLDAQTGISAALAGEVITITTAAGTTLAIDGAAVFTNVSDAAVGVSTLVSAGWAATKAILKFAFGDAFQVASAVVQVLTSAGVVKAFVGKVTVTSEEVSVQNPDSGVAFAATDVVNVLAFG